MHDGNDKDHVLRDLVDYTVGEPFGAASSTACRESLPCIRELNDPFDRLLDLRSELKPKAFALRV